MRQVTRGQRGHQDYADGEDLIHSLLDDLVVGHQGGEERRDERRHRARALPHLRITRQNGRRRRG
jgi:hypothetical protein